MYSFNFDRSECIIFVEFFYSSNTTIYNENVDLWRSWGFKSCFYDDLLDYNHPYT